MVNNTKLKTGDYIDLTDVTKEQFDACVAVAKAHGFTPTKAAVNKGLKACGASSINKYLGVFEDGKSIEFSYDGDEDLIAELTLEQWLFSCAPEWAVDIRSSYSGNGSFWYTDSKKKCREVNIAGYEMSSSIERIMKSPVIATRKPQEEKWMPKVGEKCLIEDIAGIYEAEITYWGVGVGCYVWLETGNEYTFNKDDVSFDPLPPSLEEQLTKDLSEAHGAQNSLDSSYLDTLVKRLIKKGWKK